MSSLRMSMIKTLAMIAVLAAAGVSSAALEGNPERPLKVFVSIPPQAFFVERIGGDRVSVHSMIGAGQTPHAFEPTPRQLAELSKANIYFAIGFSFEKRLLQKAKGVNPKLLIVHTEGGVPRTEHDPHIWLSPILAKIQAEKIAHTLANLDPEGGKSFAQNLKEFDAELDRIAAKITRALAPYRGMPFYVYHPAWGYFAEAFGLKQVSIEHEGKEPGAHELVELINDVRKHDVKVIFSEPYLYRSNAEAIAKEMGVRIEILDSLAENYFANLESMAEKIAKALAKEKR